MEKKAADIVKGDMFPSPRADEGIVRAECDYGMCMHETDLQGNPGRPDSVHVFSYSWGTEFFIAMYDKEDIHICDEECRELLHEPTIEGIEHKQAHPTLNQHAQ